MATQHRGHFIAIEGCEGAGKSTQAALLADRLGAVLTSEPRGTELGHAVRQISLDARIKLNPVAEVLMLQAASSQHVDDVIRPALNSRLDVVTDRFVGSILAYQGFGRGVPLETIKAAARVATRCLLPDIVIMIDVPLDLAAERLVTRAPDVDAVEDDDFAFHERVRHGFRELARKEPNWVLVNGEGPADEVHESICAALAKHLAIEIGGLTAISPIVSAPIAAEVPLALPATAEARLAVSEAVVAMRPPQMQRLLLRRRVPLNQAL